MASTITGMTKFFYKNYLYGVYLSSVTATSGDFAYAYDNDPNTYYESVGSTDLTTETITINFSTSMSINRLMAIRQNWKQFTIQYWNGSAWTDFTSVYTTKNGSPASLISYTTNSDATIYFEFATVSTTKIRIQIVKTFVVDAQKYCYEFYVGKEIGTMTDDIFCKPNDTEILFDEGEKIITLSNQGSRQILKGKKMQANIKLKQVLETADQTIIATLFSERQIGVLFNGAYDVYSHEGFRMQDLYTGVVSKDFGANHSIGRDKTVGYEYSFKILGI